MAPSVAATKTLPRYHGAWSPARAREIFGSVSAVIFTCLLVASLSLSVFSLLSPSAGREAAAGRGPRSERVAQVLAPHAAEACPAPCRGAFAPKRDTAIRLRMP